MAERELATCPQCGHLLYESNRRPGSDVAPCPGCGTEVALAPPTPRLEVVSAPSPSEPPAAPPPEEFVPSGFRLTREGSAIAISFGEPRAMKPLGVVAWVIAGAVTVALSIAHHQGLSLVWPALIAAVTLVVLIARSPLITLRARNGVVTVERLRRSREVSGTRRFHAEATGKAARLVAEGADGARSVVVDELTHFSDARWLAERLNRELR